MRLDPVVSKPLQLNEWRNPVWSIAEPPHTVQSLSQHIEAEMLNADLLAFVRKDVLIVPPGHTDFLLLKDRATDENYIETCLQVLSELSSRFSWPVPYGVFKLLLPGSRETPSPILKTVSTLGEAAKAACEARVCGIFKVGL